MITKDQYNVECIDDGVIISKSGPVCGYRNPRGHSVHFRCNDRTSAVFLARIVLGEWEELRKYDFDVVINVNEVGFIFDFSTSDEDEDEYEDDYDYGEVDEGE